MSAHAADGSQAQPVTETVTYTTVMNHLTERPDGSFNFKDFETGYVIGDYVDPAIPDTRWKPTNTFSINMTPGGTWTQTETLRQFDANIQINYRYHLTVVDGETKVEREVSMVRGCP